jgi:hypothetical protein
MGTRQQSGGHTPLAYPVQLQVHEPGQGLQGLLSRASAVEAWHRHISKLKGGELLQPLQHASWEPQMPAWVRQATDAEVVFKESSRCGWLTLDG